MSTRGCRSKRSRESGARARKRRGTPANTVVLLSTWAAPRSMDLKSRPSSFLESTHQEPLVEAAFFFSLLFFPGWRGGGVHTLRGAYPVRKQEWCDLDSFYTAEGADMALVADAKHGTRVLASAIHQPQAFVVRPRGRSLGNEDPQTPLGVCSPRRDPCRQGVSTLACRPA